MNSSLDPRVARMENGAENNNLPTNSHGITYEVFHKERQARPFVHVGVVHASSPELALIFAKEQFGRRKTTFGLSVVQTDDVSICYEDNTNVIRFSNNTKEVTYEVYIQTKSGAQPIANGTLKALNPMLAIEAAKSVFIGDKKWNCIWVMEESKVTYVKDEDLVIFETTPEKVFRNPEAYKVRDLIEAYRTEHGLA